MSKELTSSDISSLTDDVINTLSPEQLKTYLTAASAVLNKSRSTGVNRKYDVLSILQEGPHTILEIADRVGINSKNVSSQLSYLRRDGWVIHTDEKSRKYLSEATPRISVTQGDKTVENVDTVDPVPAEAPKKTRKS